MESSSESKQGGLAKTFYFNPDFFVKALPAITLVKAGAAAG